MAQQRLPHFESECGLHFQRVQYRNVSGRDYLIVEKTGKHYLGQIIKFYINVYKQHLWHMVMIRCDENGTYLWGLPLQNLLPEPNHEKNFRQIKLRDIIQNTLLGLLKTGKDIKNRESHRKSSPSIRN